MISSAVFLFLASTSWARAAVLDFVGLGWCRAGSAVWTAWGALGLAGLELSLAFVDYAALVIYGLVVVFMVAGTAWRVRL